MTDTTLRTAETEAVFQRDLDRVEALTQWCRDNVAAPPAALLYAAVGAVENLRRMLATERDAEGPRPIAEVIQPIVERARRLGNVEGPLG